MLRALELYLATPLDAALPAAVEVQRGPFLAAPGWPPARRVLNIHARRLDVHHDPPPRTIDGPAFSFQTATWPINGVVASFTVPPAMTGEIMEVEAPAGYLRKLGDDYYLDNRTIRFFHAPVGPGEARASVRVATTSGYRRRSPATLALDLTAYTRDLSTADALIEDALQLLLVQLDRTPYFAFQNGTGLGTTVRFCDFRPHVVSLERTVLSFESVIACSALVELEGELDLLVPSGSPVPVGIIESIQGEVTTEGGADVLAPLVVSVDPQ
jgi:hypothetical protein